MNEVEQVKEKEKMKVDEANLIIAKFMNDYDCYNCKNRGVGGGPKFHHEYPTCTIEGRYFEDYEGCKDFKVASDSYDYGLSLNELLAPMTKLYQQNGHFDVYRITSKIAYYIMFPEEGDAKGMACVALAEAIGEYS